MSTTNGQPPVPDPELISAFYDAETTAEELAAVQQSMADSNEPVQTLEDYEQLSLTLRDLHRAKPAPDLQAAVMLAVSQGEGIGKLIAPDLKSASRSRRRVLQIVAGLTGLAAAVALLLWPFAHVPPGDAVVIDNGDISRGVGLPEVAAMSVADGEFNGRREFTSSNGVADEPFDSARFARGVELDSGTDEMEANIAFSLERIASERPLPEVGDVVGYLDHNADDLTWVAVTVADVQDAGGKVQLLLTRHGVESLAGTSSQLESVQKPNEQVTFVVEADWDQMEAVIVDLSEETFIQSVEVDAPSDEGVPTELQNYAYNREDGHQLVDGTNPTWELQQRVLDRKGQSRNAASADPKEELAERFVGNAVQLQANVPDVELRRIAAKRSAEFRSSASPEVAAAERLQGKVKEPTSEGAIRRSFAARPRAKVLIVLQAK